MNAQLVQLFHKQQGSGTAEMDDIGGFEGEDFNNNNYSDIQQDSSNDDENKENIEKSLDKVFLHI
ncbi:MAG: hypothetical protein GX297_04385 [Treponema sp.]|jgi:hypothetical protein|nr:hypothetical protein [Treponema sp.]